MIAQSQGGMQAGEATRETAEVLETFRAALLCQVGSRKQLKEQLDRLRKRREMHGGGAAIEQRNSLMNTQEAFVWEELLSAKAEQKEARRQTNQLRKRNDALRMVEAGLAVHRNVLMPAYERDDRLKVYRETNEPPESLYMAIGYDGAVTDQMPTRGERHYRKFYMDELENNKEIFKKSPFYTAPIVRGQSRVAASGFLGGLLGGAQESSLKEVGSFKGHVSVYNEEDRDVSITSQASQLIEIE